MNRNEGVRRIVIVLRVIGFLILAAGIVGLQPRGVHDQMIVAIVTAVFAGPFFVLAWIIDGFASSGQREADALIAQMRRNAQLGRRALNRHHEV